MQNRKRYPGEKLFRKLKNNKKLITILSVISVLCIMLLIFKKPIGNYLGVQSVGEFFQVVAQDLFEEFNSNQDQVEEYVSELPSAENNESEEESLPNYTTLPDGTLEMHMIDVGQADSFLFVQGDKVLLIDAGTAGGGDEVVEYLKELRIDKIDILIGSHPDNDHMGGITKVVNNFEIERFYFPRRTDVTTQWYMTMLETIVDKKTPCASAEQGDIIAFGDASIQFITSTDAKEDKSVNDSSIAVRITYGEIDFLMCGDAEEETEKDILASGLEIESDVFKASHHGSKTSNIREFVEEVNPVYAFISCGKDNKHNHPNKIVVELFKELGIPVYRTDEQGSVIATTDGTSLVVSEKPGSYNSGEDD